MRSPTKEEVAAARAAAGLSQPAAAAIVYSNKKTWQNWEYGVGPMHPGLWELFLMKTKAARRKAMLQPLPTEGA